MIPELIAQFQRLTFLENKFIVAGIILIAAVIFAKVILLIFERYLEKFAAKTKTKVDDIIFARTKRPIFYLIVVYGLQLAVQYIGWNGILSKIIYSLMAIVFVYILASVTNILISTWGLALAKRTKTSLDEVLLPLVIKTSNVVFVLIAFMWVLRVWRLDITPYLAGVGISGIVLGLALQDTLKNVFGGISVILDKTFQVGDKVKLESGEVGEIHDIGLRSTKLVTYDNEIIYIPNGQLAYSRVQNYTHPTTKIRVKVPFGVEYGTKIEKVKEVVLPLLKKDSDILDDPEPNVQFLEMGDSELQFQAVFWVENWQDGYSMKLKMVEEIYNKLNKESIGIPFPTRTVYLKKG